MWDGDPEAPPGPAVNQQYSHTASSNNVKDDFTPAMCNTLPQEDVEAGREMGLNGYLAPTGENHSFQGCLTQGLDLKSPSWEDAQARTAPGTQPSPNQFGDFILVLSCAPPIRNRAKKGRGG